MLKIKARTKNATRSTAAMFALRPLGIMGVFRRGSSIEKIKQIKIKKSTFFPVVHSEFQSLFTL